MADTTTSDSVSVPVPFRSTEGNVTPGLASRPGPIKVTVCVVRLIVGYAVALGKTLINDFPDAIATASVQYGLLGLLALAPLISQPAGLFPRYAIEDAATHCPVVPGTVDGSPGRLQTPSPAPGIESHSLCARHPRHSNVTGSQNAPAALPAQCMFVPH